MFGLAIRTKSATKKGNMTTNYTCNEKFGINGGNLVMFILRLSCVHLPVGHTML